MTVLTDLLDTFRDTAHSEREKGTYFERLVKVYLQHEPYYADLYAGHVWLWEEWRLEAARRGLGDVGADSGVDLVAETTTGELHAIQAKFYAEDTALTHKALSTFIALAGQKQYAHGFLFLTSTHSTAHLRNALKGQKTPISIVTLQELEASRIDWSRYQPGAAPVLKPRKSLRPHQQHALDAVEAGFQQADRGKLIMACGTGKTFVSLKIAEAIAGAGGRVLFLVPSLALLSQALTEWTQEAALPLHSYAVCSDTDVGKKKLGDDFEMLTHELQYPATTDAASFAAAITKRAADASGRAMTAVFSTYQSIDVISQAQRECGLATFDLVICDEAHRTTGATFDGDDESHFVKVHNAGFIAGARRLYMTATPRIYSEHAKVSAERDNVVLASMDDPATFGKTFFTLTFSEAVERGLLSDYKVIVLAVEEKVINRRLQKLLASDRNDLKMDDAARIVGCWKALSKQGLVEELQDDAQPMKRAVAFCHVIEAKPGAKTHRVGSKNIQRMFQAVVEEYQRTAEDADERAVQLTCEAEHIDGSMNAAEKGEKLDWLRAEPPSDTCRILTNVRCLSEGVDVPALDAVLFLTPRNSQVDVVQAVGRVMRKSPGKERGYIILPVVIPVGVEPHEALNDNVTYKVVWQVLQALRSHDDRFDAMVNKLEFNGADPSKMEVIAITDKVPTKSAAAGMTPAQKHAGRAKGAFTIGQPVPDMPQEQAALHFEIGEIERAIYAKLVQKVGNRHHWEEWAADIAKIAATHIDRIHAILENSEYARERRAFDRFAAELRDDLNDAITDDEIVEMLAQHLVTRPVFEALFPESGFADKNPMSKALQRLLNLLEAHNLEKEADTLQAFYASVKLRAEGIKSAAGKQQIIKELYDRFFNGAFPALSKRLGIVYTPVEIVDFIIASVQHVLKTQFGTTLGDRDVHILDPFTGTGTFVTRLLQSGFITKEDLPYKYRHEIHANEIILLAYYIAAINIESTYHDLSGGAYVPFDGICLTDTFQMSEKEDLVDQLLVDNSARRKRQKALDIRVILGNPPYSAGQESANDNNANVAYPHLDGQIRDTYAARSTATNKNALYDSYIRAIRWASDRIGGSGVIGYVTNAGWIEANTADGLRKCLAEEFSDLYVFHLRGNARTSGEQRRKEKDNVFGVGSRAPIAISILVKNPAATEHGRIFFHDIGDYLTREEKLERITAFGSIAGITKEDGWHRITPDAHGDWLRQRDDSFGEFIAMGDKKGKDLVLFQNYSGGVKTNRDAWCNNASRLAISANMTRMIAFYNNEVARFDKVNSALDRKTRDEMVDSFINTDATKISWDYAQKVGVSRGRMGTFHSTSLIISLYRPFTKQWLYYDGFFNNRVYQMPRIFPDIAAENIVVQVSGVGARQFSVLASKALPCLDNIEKGQCFPLYLYDEATEASGNQLASGLFGNVAQPTVPTRRDAITDAGLAHFQSAYPGEAITKEDLFYYVYGLLHSPDYRERYADNLSKELPRIPRLKTAAAFRAFSQAGRALADLHLNYESVPMYAGAVVDTGGKTLTDADYRVVKMKVPKAKGVKDLTRLIYNSKITVSGIPPEAYDYVVNGKAALDWVIERQCVKTDKASGIVNDANDWAVETMHNPRYPLELFLRVITVSLETIKIVAALPHLDIQQDKISERN